MREFMSVPVRQKIYQAFGDILLDFPHTESSEYRRSLDLDTAVTSVHYVHGGAQYDREVFASWPGKVVVVRVTASKPGSVSFVASLNSAHDGATIVTTPNGEISMTGRVVDSAIRFEARLLIKTDGGRQESRAGKISVTGANSAVLILAGATNFVNYKDVSADPKKRNDSTLAA